MSIGKATISIHSQHNSEGIDHSEDNLTMQAFTQRLPCDFKHKTLVEPLDERVLGGQCHEVLHCKYSCFLPFVARIL